jgi:hypothetical protein
MPQRIFDAIIFCEDPPTIELRNGMFHITQQISPGYFTERVMRPHVFLKALRAANRVAAEFHRGRRNVVAIPAITETDEEEAVAH